MKFAAKFKIAFYATAALLFASGAIAWALQRWFPVDRGFGPEPSPTSILWLQTHAVIGQVSLVVFGYLLSAHVAKVYNKQKKLRTGYTLLSLLVLEIATVPILYYAAQESLKSATAAVHTYLGLALPVFLVLHLLLNSGKRSKRRTSNRPSLNG